ncbi:MAG: cation diffusion facilitator family transporter [Planctomycetota bacterium]
MSDLPNDGASQSASASARPEETGRYLTPYGVTWVGLIANASLSSAKIAIGLMVACQTLVVDGLHSASDLVTDAAVLLSMGASNRPADQCHPYGHRRISTLAALFIGAMLALAAVWTGWRAIGTLERLFDEGSGVGRALGFLPFALAVASLGIKELLYRITILVARRTGDLSLRANAWHHRSDAFTSLAATIGLAGATFAGPRWAFLDAGTALVLAAFLLVVGVGIAWKAAAELIDRAPGETATEAVRRAVGETEGVQGFHAFRARQIGGRVAVDVHVQVDPMLTVRRGHDIAAAVKRAVLATDSHVIEVMVHIEPAVGG